MKMRSSITFTIITAILAVSIQSVTTAQRPNQGQLLANAQLSDKQTNQLKSLGVKVAIPSYIPAGFRVSSVQVEPCPPGIRRSCPQYAIIYRNSTNNSCFAIESTGGGVGGTGLADSQRSYPVNNPILGKSEVIYGKDDRRSGPNLPTLTGDWMGQGPFYRFLGANSRIVLGTPVVVTVLSNCSDISPQEAVRVSESLRYLP